MGQPSAPTPVKLFVITLHRDPDLCQRSLALFRENWGQTDYISREYPFEETNYYEQEMGANLQRRFYSFESLISPDRIVEAKLECNRIEEQFQQDSRRQVNLDAGYLDTYKVVLASAKFGGQKIYLREGIYADMTLTMYKGKWTSFLWGFPDFKSGKYDDELCRIRDLYKKQLHRRDIEAQRKE